MTEIIKIILYMVMGGVIGAMIVSKIWLYNIKKWEKEGLLKWSKDMSEWISVKDRLPEKEDLYLIFLPKYGVDFGYWRNDGWDIEFYGSCHDTPTHWMPLPLPPKE